MKIFKEYNIALNTRWRYGEARSGAERISTILIIFGKIVTYRGQPREEECPEDLGSEEPDHPDTDTVSYATLPTLTVLLILTEGL